MEKMLMNYNDELKIIFLDYQNYLTTNHISSHKSLGYIYDIINFYEINNKYIEKVEFDFRLKCRGVFIPNQKKIIINTAMLEAANHLGFITNEQMIIDYFCLLLHEINHILQFRYRDLINDDITFLLNISEFLKVYSQGKNNELHDLFSDEIDSNIRSAKLLYEIYKNKITEQNLIYFLTLSTIYKNKIINSQLNYLYTEILKTSFNEKFQNINSLYYGLKKDEDLLQSIIDSYQTHKLCVDIDGERRLKKCN